MKDTKVTNATGKTNKLWLLLEREADISGDVSISILWSKA